MDGLFTALTEASADRIAPKLAQVSLAAGIYVLLYSRVFATKNNIGISVSKLAEVFGKDRRSIQRAVSRLVDEGLIDYEVYGHSGGGSVFHLIGVEGEALLTRRETSGCDKKRRIGCDENAASGVTKTPHQMRPICRTTNIRGVNSGYKHESQSPYDYDY